MSTPHNYLSTAFQKENIPVESFATLKFEIFHLQRKI